MKDAGRNRTSFLVVVALIWASAVHGADRSAFPPGSLPASIAVINPGTWNQTVNAPFASAEHAAVYDPDRQSMLVFASQLLELSLGTNPAWSIVDPHGYGAGGSGAAVYDPVRHRTIALWTGGVSAFSFSGGPAWASLPSSGGPTTMPAFPAITAAYDPARDRILAYGYGTQGDELWEVPLGGPIVWNRLIVSGTGPGGSNGKFTAIHDPVRDRLIVMDYQMRAWAIDLAGPLAWYEVVAQGTPPPFRLDAVAVYDGLRDRIVVTSGYDVVNPPNQEYMSDTQALTLSGTPRWDLMHSGGPSAKKNDSMVYDVLFDRMVLFGGMQRGSLSKFYYDYTWFLDFGSVSEDPDIDLSPTSLALGTVVTGSTGSGSVLVVNRGRQTLEVYDVFPEDESVVASPTSFTLEPMASRAVDVTWTPVASGTLHTQIQFSSNDPGESSRGLLVTGTAQDPSGVGGHGSIERLVLRNAGGNPARGGARLELALPVRGAAEVEIWDVRGVRVARLLSGVRDAGRHALVWDGTDASGARARAGLYFVRARAMGEQRALTIALVP